MKRKSLLFALAFLSSTMCSVARESFISGGIRYEIEDDSTVCVIPLGDTDKYEGDVTIPTSVSYNGVEYNVIGIGSMAFYKCDNLTSITISDGPIYINEYAFAQCGKLTSVNIPNSIQRIYSHVFDNTVWYEAQPDGVLYAGKVAYKYKGTMAQDTSIVIKEGTITIADYAFERCSNLKAIEIPSTVLSIGAYAFYNCAKLASVTVPQSVYNVGIGTFEGTAWYDAQPDGIIYIGSMLYGYKGDRLLGDTLVVREGTKSINRQSLPCQSRLKAVIIPEGVTIIGVEAFYHCENMDSVHLPGSLTFLSAYSFAECVNIKSITIPHNVDYIGSGAFDRCDKLMSIRSLSVIPPTMYQNAFTSTVYDNAVLYVPAESVNDYKNADGWNQFSNIREIATTGVDMIGSNNASVEYYDLSGIMIDAPKSGFNIIKYRNGLTKQVFIKEE